MQDILRGKSHVSTIDQLCRQFSPPPERLTLAEADAVLAAWGRGLGDAQLDGIITNMEAAGLEVEAR